MDYTLEQLSDMDPRKLQPGDRVSMKVVAVVGYANDWAAYFDGEDKTIDEVARHGYKATKSAAESLFSRIKYVLYYRD